MLKLPELPVRSSIRSVGVLCSGGDAPGMNAAVRAVVRYAITHGLKVHGIMKGYSGLLEGQFREMDLSSVANIIQRGGTILKTDRCEAFFRKGARREAANLLRRNGIDALVVIGGDGSYAGAHKLGIENRYPVIGVPGTIDNDVPGTDDTIGFDTAVNTGIEAIDRIRDTASSHDRLFIVEVMGRSAGFIAIQVGIGGGAETIVVPGVGEPVESIAKTIQRGVKRGKTSSIIVVAEGAECGGATGLAAHLKKRGYSPRVCILGHTQRGGRPTAHDRFLASGLGAAAVAYLITGYSDAMVGIQAGNVKLVPFRDVIGYKKQLPKEYLRLLHILST